MTAYNTPLNNICPKCGQTKCVARDSEFRWSSGTLVPYITIIHCNHCSNTFRLSPQDVKIKEYQTVKSI